MGCKAEQKLHIALMVLALAAVTTPLEAQQKTDAAVSAPGVGELEKHIDEMSARIDSMRQELVDSRNEIQAMHAELLELRRELAGKNADDTEAAVSALRTSVEQLQETSDVLQADVKQQDQTKVETVSKYPVRISGTVLFTALSNSGTTDNIDLPIVALPPQPNEPQGSFSATARQTILGLDATGPHFGSASSSAALSVDFFGGIPYSETATAAGLLRLRTAHATLAWPNRALTVAFDRPILTPREPTSWITVGEPALAWSGNLWNWAPQLEFSQYLSRGWTGKLALIDPPAPGNFSSTGERMPDPAEKSRQPGYEAHLGNAIEMGGSRMIEWGAGGYYSRQAYANDQHLDAWTGSADWSMALASPLEISGMFYRGRGIGGLGGGAFKDYVPFDNYTEFRGLDAEGGWGQVKWRFSPIVEANVAAGEDNAFANELRDSDYAYATGLDIYQNLARNLTAYGNVVYRPHTYLLFSAEYRQIRSWPIAGSANDNHIFGVATGYLF
jgi:regulator of replication initiation timing